jgi:hypothetical protein
MPSPADVLAGLTAIARDWAWLAIAWHLLLGVFALALLGGWRPRGRVVALLFVLPLVSVSGLAWTSGNPFNGLILALIALALARAALRVPTDPMSVHRSALAVCGVALLAFAWVYPHFVAASSWATYLYAAPLGLVPCPTLSAVAGVTLLFGGFRSRSWSRVVAAAGLLYGLIGVLWLGVTIDLALVAGAVVVGATTARDAGDHRPAASAT